MKEKIVRFKRILKMKELDRSLVQKKLAELQAMESDVLSRLKSLRDDKERFMSVFSKTSAGVFSIDVIRRRSDDIVRVEEDIKNGIVEVFKIRKEIESVQKELVESHREVKKIELHLEHLKVEMDRIIRLEEQKVVDDMASVLYSRRNGREK